MHRIPQALSASARLIESAANALSVYTPIKAGQKIATVAGNGLVAATDLSLLGWPGLPYHLTLTTNTATPSAGRLAGAAVGRLELDAGQEQATTDIIR